MATIGNLTSRVLIAAALPLATPTNAQIDNRAVISCSEDIVRFDGHSNPIAVPAKKGITLRLDSGKRQFFVVREGKTLSTSRISDLLSNIEALWSQDGRAFAINYSDGGFHVRVFLIRGDKVTDVSTVRTIARHKKAPSVGFAVIYGEK